MAVKKTAETEVKEVKEVTSKASKTAEVEGLKHNLIDLANILIEQVKGKQVSDLNATIDLINYIKTMFISWSKPTNDNSQDFDRSL